MGSIRSGMPHCGSCQQPIKTDEHKQSDGFVYEMHNELHITIEGGYQSFVDTFEGVGGKTYEYVICHDCAVKLCTTMLFTAVLRQHANMIECPCPGGDERKARFDTEIRLQKEKYKAKKAYEKAKPWLDPAIEKYRKEKGEEPVT